MTVRTLKTETGICYYCTFTCYKWLPLFELTKIHDAIYRWFDYLVENGHQIVGFVIMNNHMHCIIHIKKGGPTINRIIGNAKRLLAYEIVERLKNIKREDILHIMQEGVSDKEKLKGDKHKVFEASFDGKECFTYDFLIEKLRYIHNNPVKAGLVTFPEEYIHSSAKFYFTNEQGIYPVTHFIEIFDGREVYEFSIGIKKKDSQE